MRLAILFVVLVGAGMLAVASVKAPAGFFSTWAEVQTAAQANHKLIFRRIFK